MARWSARTIQQAGLRHLERIYLAEIERDGSVITAVAPEEVLRGGDRLVFVGETEAIVDVLRINGLVAAVGSQPALERNVPERRLVEAVVARALRGRRPHDPRRAFPRPLRRGGAGGGAQRRAHPRAPEFDHPGTRRLCCCSRRAPASSTASSSRATSC